MIGGKIKQQKVDRPNIKSKTEVFFEAGSYGCVRYPQVKCNGKIMTKKQLNKKGKNSDLMSKISEINFFSLNELEVSNFLEKHRSKIENDVIDTWIYVEKNCSLQRKKLNKDFEYEKCPKISKKVNKESKSKEYMLLYTKFLPSTDYSKYLNNDFGIHKIFKLYYYQISCAKICNDLQINHQDMHLQNILVDENEKLYLIDFGLTMMYKNFFTDDAQSTLDMTYLKNIFVSYQPNWIKLPVDYHICAFYIYEDRPLREKDLQYILDSNLDKNDVFNYFEHQKDAVKKRMFEYFKDLYVNKSNTKDCIKHILQHYFHTWDVYQINFISLLLIKSYLKDYNMILDYISMCKSGISHNYKIRGNAQKYLNISSAIFQNYFDTSDLVYDDEYHVQLNQIQKNTLSFHLSSSYHTTLA